MLSKTQICESQWGDLKEKLNNLEKVSEGDELYGHLSQKTDRGWTALHYVCLLSDTCFVKEIIPKLSPTQINKLLQIQTDNTAKTPMFYMRSKGSDMLDTETKELNPRAETNSIRLWSKLTETEKFYLLNIIDIYGDTALHERACDGSYVILQKLLQPLSPAHRLELMAIKNNQGQTVMEAAEASNVNSSESVDVLENIAADSGVELLIGENEKSKQMGK